MFERKEKITYIGDKIFEVGKHVIVVREDIFNQEIEGCSQIEIKEGYRIISSTVVRNMLEDSIYLIYINEERVNVAGYIINDGEPFYPKPGKIIKSR